MYAFQARCTIYKQRWMIIDIIPVFRTIQHIQHEEWHIRDYAMERFMDRTIMDTYINVSAIWPQKSLIQKMWPIHKQTIK